MPSGAADGVLLHDGLRLALRYRVSLQDLLEARSVLQRLRHDVRLPTTHPDGAGLSLANGPLASFEACPAEVGVAGVAWRGAKAERRSFTQDEGTSTPPPARRA